MTMRSNHSGESSSREGRDSDRDAGSERRVAIHTLGCRLNMAESEMMRRQMAGEGFQLAGEAETADVVIVNTCTVTAAADGKSRQAIRGARRKHPGATLAVTGCFAQLHPEEAARDCGADLVVGNGEKMALPGHALALLEGTTSSDAPKFVMPRMERKPFAVGGFDPGTLVLSDGDTRAHLKIQDGCDFMCAFCLIPSARGRARARSLDNLLAEGEALLQAGVREIVLTGVNVGTYRQEEHGLLTVVDRLAALNSESGQSLSRLRIGSIEPTTVPEGLLERMADSAHPLVPFLHLPLQSGSARVLAAMGRRYGPGDYRAFAEQALARVPDLCLGADVLVGHPGEDDEAFAETVEFTAGLPFAYLHVFPFSSRPGTAAHRMENTVPDGIIRRRAATMRTLGENHREAFHRRFLGRTLPVLFERPRDDGTAQGYTANYIRVGVPGNPAEDWRNRTLPVRLLESGGGRMAGVLEAVVEGRN